MYKDVIYFIYFLLGNQAKSTQHSRTTEMFKCKRIRIDSTNNNLEQET